jgi:hypothetical protein
VIPIRREPAHGLGFSGRAIDSSTVLIVIFWVRGLRESARFAPRIARCGPSQKATSRQGRGPNPRHASVQGGALPARTPPSEPFGGAPRPRTPARRRPWLAILGGGARFTSPSPRPAPGGCSATLPLAPPAGRKGSLCRDPHPVPRCASGCGFRSRPCPRQRVGPGRDAPYRLRPRGALLGGASLPAVLGARLPPHTGRASHARGQPESE